MPNGDPQMPIATLLLPRMTCLLVLAVACIAPTHALAQADQEKDKTAAPQDKKPDERKPDTTIKSGGMEILSDTMGVDFGPYVKQLKRQIQTHWEPLIPEAAMPPLNKTGTVVIELMIMKSGAVTAMKVVKSSGDVPFDRAAWGAITTSLPLPTLPPEFKGEFLLLRGTFLYNPEKPETAKSPEPAKQEQKK
jgi:TonB family protein